MNHLVGVSDDQFEGLRGGILRAWIDRDRRDVNRGDTVTFTSSQWTVQDGQRGSLPVARAMRMRFEVVMVEVVVAGDGQYVGQLLHLQLAVEEGS